MSEDEIIKEMKQKINCNEDSDCNECPYIMRPECLLDLYQKEKALTKNHKIAFEKQTENLHEVEDLYQKEKEKNKELQSYMKTNLIPKSTINLLYSSKNNIRELLEKYDKDIAWDSADDHYYFTKFIQELLGGGNAKNK